MTTSWLLAPLPLLYLAAALGVSEGRPFRSMAWGTRGGLLLALLWPLAAYALSLPGPGVATAAMLLLVTGLTAAIARYSQTYLRGEPGQARYARTLLLTAAAVTSLVATDHLLILVGAWMATSGCVHRLLTFYADRAPAQIAAHKKFLVARVADGALLGAVLLIVGDSGSWSVAELNAAAAQAAGLSLPLHAAMVLLVASVLLRSAQLPFHGWMIQVMEAPTPVSALLHAGIVNLGGFVLLKLGPTLMAAPIARGLLLAVGLTTAVVGALVMTTRVSVKVNLAWSTIAQMGFLLVQCALGAWPLVMLHLLAHSLYKAHAFLSAGSTVSRWSRSTALAAARPTALHLGAVTVGLGVAVAAVVTTREPLDPATLPLGLLLGLSLVPLWGPRSPGDLLALAATAWSCLWVSLAYGALHAGFGALVPAEEAARWSGATWLIFAALGGLAAVQATLWLRPEGALAQWLHPRLFAAFHLDEWITRFGFWWWPPPTPDAPTSRRAATHTTEEVQSC